MDASIALQVLLWAAVIVVYLGLAAVLREIRLLRAQVSRLQARVASLTAGNATGEAGIRLPAGVVDVASGHVGGEGILLVADTTCPSCAAVLARLVEHRDAGRLISVPTILTWEDPQLWHETAPGLRVVRDEAAWSALAHLTPPLLVRAAADGRVVALDLPADLGDVDTTLESWGALVPTFHDSRRVTP